MIAVNKKIIYYLMVIFLISISCERDKGIAIFEYEKSAGVFILNEGNFTSGNSSLSFYEPALKKLSNDVFYNANGFPVGDALQSISFNDTTAYLCISNSAKVFVFNSRSFKHIKTIPNLVAPRYLKVINSEKAYISDLYSPYISIMNLKTNEISGSIRIGHSTENFVTYGDLLFVNSWSYNDKIYILNSNTDILLDSITVRKQPNSMVIDKNNKLWVLSDGGYDGSPYGQVNAALTKINVDNFSVEKIFEFKDIHNSPVKLCINPGADSLFFLSGGWGKNKDIEGGVFAFSIADESLPTKAFIKENNKNFYGLAIDPESSHIYCSDALDYLQSGYVYSFAPNGTAIDSFKVGIAPGGFGFLKTSR